MMCSLYRREHYGTLSHRRLGHRAVPWANVRFGSEADICGAKGHVRFTPRSGHVQCTSLCPLCANSGHR